MRKSFVTVTFLSVVLILMQAPAWATQALCFNCGELHIGALNACDKCGFQPDIENSTLWTTFSDHFMPAPIMNHFGDVLKKIGAATPDFEEKLWTFFQYILDNYPQNGMIDPSSFKLPDKYKQSVPKLLKELNLPVVDLKGIMR